MFNSFNPADVSALPTGVIIGTVVGILIAIAICIVVVLFTAIIVIKIKKNKSKHLFVHCPVC